MGNEIKVEVGGKLNPSFESTVDRMKSAIKANAKDLAEMGATAVVAESKHRVLSATAAVSWDLVRFVAARALSTILPAAAGAISGMSLVLGSVKILSGALHLLERASGTASAGLGRFSMLEDLAGRLRRVSSSAEAARQKVSEVAATFRGTSVAVPDAVNAYRSARVADSGSGELSSAKGLTMLGDVAAASGNGISEVAAEVGNLYAALQAGKPIEESADKLREMGVISGDTRQELDRMLASGRSGAEVWASLRNTFERSTGAMKEQQQTLSGLQKAVQSAKDQLYESFGEGSVGFEKDKLSAQLAVLQKIEPAAREAGSVYGGFKSIISDNIKAFLSLIGVKAASDKALGNSEGLKKAADGYIVLRVALAAFAAAALVATPIYAGLAIAAGTLSLAVIGTAAAFAGIAAAAVAAVATLGIYVIHLKQVAEARLAYVTASAELINGLQKEQNEMVTAADRAKVLANAYAIAKKAREDFNNAKNKGEKTDAGGRLNAAQAEIGKIENFANTLIIARAKLRQQIAEAKTFQDRAPLVLQEAQLTERINRGERGTAADFPLGGAAGEAEAAAKQGHEDLDLNEIANRAERRAHDEKEKASELADRAFEAEQASNPDATDALRQQSDDLRHSATKANREAINREKRIAELEPIRNTLQAGPEIDRLATEAKAFRDSAQSDNGKADEIDTRRAGLAQSAVQARADAALQAQAATKTSADAAEARKKATDEANKKAQDSAEATVADAEIEARNKIAALQSQGIQRTREEYEINRQLLETKIQQAEAVAKITGDETKLKGLQADYYRDQQAQAKREEEALRANRDGERALFEARSNRQNAADRRQVQHDLQAGKIDAEEARKREAKILDDARRRILEDADQKEKDADEAKGKGDSTKELQLRREAVELRARADTQEEDSRNLLLGSQQSRPVADNLARLGLGGNVGLSDPGRSLEIKMEKGNSLLSQNLEVLKQIRDKGANSQVKPGYFPR